MPHTCALCHILAHIHMRMCLRVYVDAHVRAHKNAPQSISLPPPRSQNESKLAAESTCEQLETELKRTLERLASTEVRACARVRVCLGE